MRTVEVPAWNGASISSVHLDAFHFKPRHILAQQRREFPIATANIQKPGPGREHRAQLFRKYRDPALEYYFLVDAPEHSDACISAHVDARNPR